MAEPVILTVASNSQNKSQMISPDLETGKAMKEHRNTVLTFRIGKWQKAVKAEKGPLAFPDKIV